MISNRAIVWAASAVLALSSAAYAEGPATLPSAAPSVAGATTAPSEESTAKVSPEARKLLEQVKVAYGSLKSLDVAGTINNESEIDGRVSKNHAEFTGSFQAGGKFRNEIKDEMVMGFTGEKQFGYLPKTNEYMLFDAPEGKVDLTTINSRIADVLEDQNLSLALALAPDASRTLLDEAVTVTRTDDVKIDDTAFAALLISNQDVDMTLLIDPQNNMIRRQSLDVTKWALGRGAKEVKSASIVIDYKNVANASKDQQFAWAPPAGAHEKVQQAPQADEASALKGQPAPAISLEGLDGKKVTSADLKGSVYILDFWATWCGPCVASLPDLNKIYEANKAAGLKVFACNEQEEKDTVQKFVDKTKLTIPVLLDSEGKAGQSYGANAIPETVLVGKDGKVLEVFIGSGHDEEISKAAQAALKAK